MPKLNNDTAAKVEVAEDGFAPVEEGIYILRLREDVEVKEGPAGPYWKWVFEIPEGEEKAGRRFFLNTSLSEAAFFKLKETFAAFGVPTNTDTEDLVGRTVKAHITVGTVQKGARAGEPNNDISKMYPIDWTGEAPTGVSTAKVGAQGGAPADQPLF